MARKKKKTKFKLELKSTVLIGGLVVFGVIVIGASVYFFNNSDYFKVSTIKIDSSLVFIDKRDLAVLRNENIFAIDLAAMQRKLQKKYPQVKGLKVIRKFPNGIEVRAKKRVPSAQIKQSNTILTLDEQGTVLSKSSKLNNKLPQITGLARIKHATLGKPVNHIKVQAALNIAAIFAQHEKAFGSLYIQEINVSELSKVQFRLSNKLEIIVDQDKLDEKIKKLAVVLAQKKLELDKAKYVDLRFKDPIIGKK